MRGLDCGLTIAQRFREEIAGLSCQRRVQGRSTRRTAVRLRCERVLSCPRAFERARHGAARRGVVSRPTRAREPMAVRCSFPLGRIYLLGLTLPFNSAFFMLAIFFAIFLRPTEQICPQFRGTFHSFDPVGFAIFAIPLEAACLPSSQGSFKSARLPFTHLAPL